MPLPLPNAPATYDRQTVQNVINAIEERLGALEGPAAVPLVYAFEVDSAQVGDAYDETYPALVDVAAALTNLINVLKLRGII